MVSGIIKNIICKEILKRTLDLSMSIGSLIAFMPLFVVIAIWIKLDSPGPIFYRGRRIGRYSRPFLQLKFRTMVSDAEHLGSSRAPSTDTRITRVGRVLRQYKLDELPQLLNVIKGEMSLVGPRPDVEEYVALYSESEKKILELRPGITDWATLWYRDEGEVLAKFADPERAYKRYFHPTKVKLQLDYLFNHSTIMDICIIAMTLIILFRRHWLPQPLARRLVRIGEPAIVATALAIPDDTIDKPLSLESLG